MPKYAPPEERSFLTYLNDKKYKRFMQDPDKSFKNTKLVNFDIIHHECRGDKLEKPVSYFHKMWEDDFKKYLKQDNNKIIGSALRT